VVEGCILDALKVAVQLGVCCVPQWTREWGKQTDTTSVLLRYTDLQLADEIIPLLKHVDKTKSAFIGELRISRMWSRWNCFFPSSSFPSLAECRADYRVSMAPFVAQLPHNCVNQLCPQLSIVCGTFLLEITALLYMSSFKTRLPVNTAQPCEKAKQSKTKSRSHSQVHDL
jgi:hypothetical protein